MAKNAKKSLFLSFFVVIMLFLTSFLLVGCFGRNVPVTDIIIDYESVELYKGQAWSPVYKIAPKNANNYQIKFSSSNQEVASFNRNIQLVCKEYGETTVTISIVDKDISKSFKVNVTDGKPIFINLNYPATALYYYENEEISLDDFSASITFESGVIKDVDLTELEIDYPRYATKDSKIKFTYQNVSREINLIVQEDLPLEMIVNSLPNKTEYFIGEKFDASGLEVVIKYLSGKLEKIEDYKIDVDVIDVGTNKATITYGEFSESIELKAKAQRVVSSFAQLQQAVNEGVNSIMFARGANFNTSTPLLFENAKDITIYAEQNSVSLNGSNIIPIKIVGKIENVRLINFTLSTIGDNPPKNMIDLSNCSGGTLILKNMNFASSQTESLLLPPDIDLNITYNNCNFDNQEN